MLAAVVVLAAGGTPRPGAAQLPGLPVAASAFVRPGAAVAVNAGVSGGRASYGAAAGWAPAQGRWLLVGGAAAQDPGPGYESPSVALGARGGFAVVRRARLGVVAFAGAGRSRQEFAAPAGSGSPTEPSSVSLLAVPVGVSAGVRGTLGATRAWALSVAPHYAWTRFDVADDEESASRARVAVLGELALTRRIGVAAAIEVGSRAPREQPGPRGTVAGVGLSLAFGGGGASP